MDFANITIPSSYIIFNDTGFYVSSDNDITITLVYINDDIDNAGDGEKVLEFYGDTSSGKVWFNLSGFPAGNNYTVNRGGSSIGTATANNSGFISFTNNVWSSQLFEIFQEGKAANNPPVVSNIPDQTISEGGSFAQIDLDNYVTDEEDSDEDIDWSYSGNSELIVSILNRVATVSTPGSGWYGVETITFTVTAHYAPTFSSLSIVDGANKVSIGTSSLSITIEDPNGDSIDWTIETSPNIGSNSGNNDYNGSKSCSISGLAYSTTYNWFVNATDGTYWTNRSYSFTTKSASSPGQPVSSPSNEQSSAPEQNNPPETPVKPSGPTSIEVGVEYQYSSSTFDVDGDQIRYKFDWGDGHSNWSEFVASNNSLAMSHSWSSVSTYKVRVIAQDENGLNSSWSLPLNVTVSQAGLEDEIPVADIAVPSNLSTNKTIVFNASGSFDEDGIIVSYQWDFGDGENGSGITPSHVYENPGEYTVTLLVIDNNGNTYSKSMIITVTSEVEEESKDKHGIVPFNLGMVFFGCGIAILVCLAVFFRGNLKSFWSAHGVHLLSPWKIWNTRKKIEKIEAKIEEQKKKMATKTDFKRPFILKEDLYSDEIQKKHDRIHRFVDFEIPSISEEETSADEFGTLLTGEKVDKLLSMALKPKEDIQSDSYEDLDIGSTVDNLLSSYERKNLNKFGVKERMFFESDEDSILRKIDKLIESKTRRKD
ncbi:MAG: PKD domain-containing protein [Petrotogales bacterium]